MELSNKSQSSQMYQDGPKFTMQLPGSTAVYEIQYEDLMNGRYNIIDTLGEGSFGQVVRAYDYKERMDVAIKLIDLKGGEVSAEMENEINLLELILNNTEADLNNGIVKLKEHFLFEGHLCLVFELLSMNVREALDQGFNVGLSSRETLEMARQLLTSLSFLKQLNIIHCDLKPDNIMLCQPNETAIKIVDFGGSCLHGKQIYDYVTTRWYRAPEILLGLTYDHAIDMWSAGCILFEILVGMPLFKGTSEYDQMMRIVEVLGVPPADILNKAPLTARFFTKKSDGTYVPKKCCNGIKYEAPGSKPLEVIFKQEFGSTDQEEAVTVPQWYTSFINLFKNILKFNSGERATPDEALQHPLFN